MTLLDSLRLPLVYLGGQKVHCALAESAQVLPVDAILSGFHHQAVSDGLHTHEHIHTRLSYLS